MNICTDCFCKPVCMYEAIDPMTGFASGMPECFEVSITCKNYMSTTGNKVAPLQPVPTEAPAEADGELEGQITVDEVLADASTEPKNAKISEETVEDNKVAAKDDNDAEIGEMAVSGTADREQWEIELLACWNQGLNPSMIASEIGRSRTFVNNYIKRTKTAVKKLNEDKITFEGIAKKTGLSLGRIMEILA